jgi:Chromo (CHRromatin Organisation MOdifier) domain
LFNLCTVCLDPGNTLDSEELLDSQIGGTHSSLGNDCTEVYLLLVKIQNIRRLANKLFKNLGHPLWAPRITSSKLSVMDDHVVPVGRGRRKKMITQYWVKWKGYLEDDNSWVNEADIHDDLIKASIAGKSSA